MSRPSAGAFFRCTENDSNATKIRQALSAYPDLVNIQDRVSG